MRDLTAQRFGRLLVICPTGCVGARREPVWRVVCDCGSELCVRGRNLLSGNTRSCGCYQIDTVSTHGMYKHPAYKVWLQMHDRCRNSRNKQYHNYGARGIKVCRRWYRFENFWADMQSTYRSGLTLDRLNNDRGYRPSNCAWRTRSQQARNTRRVRVITTPQGSMLLCEAVEISGLPRAALLGRIKRGWPADALFLPLGTKL